MRKLFAAALVAVMSLALAAVALAQTPAPAGPTVTGKILPTKAGTKSKPKAATLDLSAQTNRKDATASSIIISLPKHVRLSGKGFPVCTATKINTDGPASCPAGSRIAPVTGPKDGPVGSANAVYGLDRVDTKFTVDVYVSGKSSLVFYVKGLVAKALNAPITRAGGKYGQKLTITIPDDLQMPGPNTFAGLLDINARIKAKRGKNNLVTTTGCPATRKHGTGVTFKFKPNAQYPGTGSSTGSSTAPCKK